MIDALSHVVTFTLGMRGVVNSCGDMMVGWLGKMKRKSAGALKTGTLFITAKKCTNAHIHAHRHTTRKPLMTKMSITVTVKDYIYIYIYMFVML